MSRGVSSVPFPFRFPFQLHCDIVSSLLALDATELVSEPLTQMVVEMINIHFSTVKEIRVKATFFFMYQSQQINFEIMLK